MMCGLDDFANEVVTTAAANGKTRGSYLNIQNIGSS